MGRVDGFLDIGCIVPCSDLKLALFEFLFLVVCKSSVTAPQSWGAVCRATPSPRWWGGGKGVYVTATLPYLLLLVLLVRALRLPGAMEGLTFLFLPREGTWGKLADIQVWLRAAGQVFFSLGLS